MFRDESRVARAAGLSAEVRSALEQSNCLIVICSPRSAQSRQVNAVVSWVKQLGRGHQILPFVIAGTPNASTGQQPGATGADECYVPAASSGEARWHGGHGPLGQQTRVRGCAVWRRSGKYWRRIIAAPPPGGWSGRRFQLIALLLGVGFDLLWARQQKFHFLELMEAQEAAAQP